MGDILSGVDGRVVQFPVGVESAGARESVSTHDHGGMEKRARNKTLDLTRSQNCATLINAVS